jgi:hypothetical protein
VYEPQFAHRIVLAAASPYFNAMFTNDVVEAKRQQIFLQSINARCPFLQLWWIIFWTNFGQISDKFRTNFGQISDKFRTNFGQISDKFRTKFWTLIIAERVFRINFFPNVKTLQNFYKSSTAQAL